MFINECNNIENEIKKINMVKENIQIIKVNKLFSSFLSDSLIIDYNNEYISNLSNWINPYQNKNSKLLYRLSRDGKKISKFHELCDDKGLPTLTLFQTDDGNKAGIYTPLSWDNKSHTKRDKETFMFNLNRNEVYKKVNDITASIYFTKDYGPWTYSFGFSKSMKIIQHCGLCINYAFENGSNILLNNTNDSKNFNIIEVEVYKIIFFY